MVAQIPIGNFVVGRELGFRCEAVEGLPFATQGEFKREAVFERQQAVRFMRRGLRNVRFQAKGSCKNVTAKSYVGDIGQATQIH